MKKVNLDRLTAREQGRVHKYKSERGDRAGMHLFISLALSGVLAVAAGIGNIVIAVNGVHRVPFTRGTTLTELHHKTIYTSDAAPEPGFILDRSLNQRDQVSWIGEPRVVSENMPHLIRRPFEVVF